MTRHNIAAGKYKQNELNEALEILEHLLPDVQPIEDHLSLDEFRTRKLLAFAHAKMGDFATATGYFDGLFEDFKYFGPEHPLLADLHSQFQTMQSLCAESSRNRQAQLQHD